MTTPSIARRLLLCACFALLSSPGQAQTLPPDLARVSIEDLLNIEITSASRKEQRATDVAAAVFVITSEDIRHSGMTTIPDLLRLVPGVEVAQINANKWAVSVRGFNALYANKLLVLVDGRSIYNRIFSGVLWDTEDLMLDDIDRIEVIRGPGAAIWGANAVNGVINIVTKTAADTAGALVRGGFGSAGAQGAARYGGKLGSANYRVYSQWSGLEESRLATGSGANDTSHSVTTGFRADWTARSGAMMLDGAFTAGGARALWPNLDASTAASAPLAADPSETSGAHVLGRWTRDRASGATLQIQSFVDLAERHEPIGVYRRHSFDIDTQYRTALSARQDVVVGAGYRFIDEKFEGGTGLSITPAEADSSLLTGFVQDEIQLFERRLAVTLGSQVQYDSQAGTGVQPTARVMWSGLPQQHVWAAASRALRTPSLNERGVHLDYPPVAGDSNIPIAVTVLGNPAARTETLLDAEAGYRLEIGAAAALDVTGFVGRYRHLVTQEPGTPSLQTTPTLQINATAQVGNLLDAETRGLEIAAHWSPASIWRLDGSYTAFHLTPHPAADSHDPTAATADGSTPGTQWQVRTVVSPASRLTVSAALFHVGPLRQLQVDGYTRADVNAAWRFSSGLSAMVIGENLLSASHAEFGGTGALLLTTRIPRSVTLRLRWMF